MITGAHAIIYSKDADADRDFLRDGLGLSHIDAGGGWLIFALPPSEVAVHPGDTSEHALYLLCDDVEAFVAKMKEHRVVCSEIQTPRWGRLTEVTLPGGGSLGVYEPRHSRPKAKAAKKSSVRRAKPGGKTKSAAARAKSSASKR